MAYGIQVLGVMGEVRNPYPPGYFETMTMWVKTFDPEFNGGDGSIDLTPIPAFALKFETFKEAFETYTAVSKTKPTRPDGKPNRPMTAFTVEVRELP